MYKVLIVEDTLAIREEIYDILLMEGYEVFQAKNGLIGFEVALKEHPDLIVSDILMPELNGFEMFEKQIMMKSKHLIQSRTHNNRISAIRYHPVTFLRYKR